MPLWLSPDPLILASRSEIRTLTGVTDLIAPDVELGSNVSIPQPALVNLYGCRVGDGTRIGAFVEVQRGAVIGRHCKISSHSFLCAGGQRLGFQFIDGFAGQPAPVDENAPVGPLEQDSVVAVAADIEDRPQ